MSKPSTFTYDVRHRDLSDTLIGGARRGDNGPGRGFALLIVALFLFYFFGIDDTFTVWLHAKSPLLTRMAKALGWAERPIFWLLAVGFAVAGFGIERLIRSRQLDEMEGDDDV